jgi:hypothetical protein
MKNKPYFGKLQEKNAAAAFRFMGQPLRGDFIPNSFLKPFFFHEGFV